MEDKTKTLEFTIKSEMKPVDVDGTTMMKMETSIDAKIDNASTEQIAGLLAYLGEDAVTKTMREFDSEHDKPQIQQVVEEFNEKREELLKGLRTALTKSMLKEMFEAMNMMFDKCSKKDGVEKTDEAEEDKPEAPAEKPEEKSDGDTTVVIIKK